MNALLDKVLGRDPENWWERDATEGVPGEQAEREEQQPPTGAAAQTLAQIDEEGVVDEPITLNEEGEVGFEEGEGESQLPTATEFIYRSGFTIDTEPGVIQFNKEPAELLKATELRISRFDANGRETSVWQELIQGILTAGTTGQFSCVLYIQGENGSAFALKITSNVSEGFVGKETIRLKIVSLHTSNLGEPAPPIGLFTDKEIVTVYIGGQLRKQRTYGVAEIGAGVASKTINHGLTIASTAELHVLALFQGTEASVLRAAALALTQIQFTRTVTAAKGFIHWEAKVI